MEKDVVYLKGKTTATHAKDHVLDYTPLCTPTLTDEQKSEALHALSVLKEKRDGMTKGRMCADGSKQQGKFLQAETRSPTIANDA